MRLYIAPHMQDPTSPRKNGTDPNVVHGSDRVPADRGQRGFLRAKPRASLVQRERQKRTARSRVRDAEAAADRKRRCYERGGFIKIRLAY